jgi:hypothetical protein
MLLENFRYTEVTRSRDHFFALLGLAPDGNDPAFEPDYDSPLENIVVKFARTFVRQGEERQGEECNSYTVLALISIPIVFYLGFQIIRAATSLHDSGESGTLYSASKLKLAKITSALDSDELTIERFDMDFIECIREASNLEQGGESYFEEIDAMITSLSINPLRDLRDDLKREVPIADMLCPRITISGGSDLRVSYISFRKHIKKAKQKEKEVEENFYHDKDTLHSMEPTGLGTGERPETLRQQSMSYIAALQETLSGWRFVTTKKGFVGVVPNMAVVGDGVTSFKGGRVPFVVQKSKERINTFRLVGKFCIHGIMYGDTAKRYL